MNSAQPEHPTLPEAPPQTGPAWTTPRWTLFIVAALGSIFLLPKLVPISPSISDSYLFGYSNRTGALLFLGFLLAGGLFAKHPGWSFRPPQRGGAIPRRVVAAWMGIYAVAGAAMYLLVHGLNGFGESLYFIDRLNRLVAGGRPYRDFEFVYGPLLLYGPRALMALRLTVEQSYFGFWFLWLLGGVWMLARILERLDYRCEQRARIFSIFCLFALPALLSTGLNYTLLRFLPATYFGLVVQRMDARGGSRQRAFAILAAIGFTAVLLTISPEMALAYAMGTAGYFAVFGRWDAAGIAAYGVLLAGEALLIVGANRLDVFATLKAFSGGAYSFPILPAAHILFFFFSCGLVCLFVAERLRGGSRGDGMLMVVAVSAGTVMAALGRCDVGHVGFAAMGLAIVAMVLASGLPRIWKGYRIAFLVFFVFLPTVTSVWSYGTLLSKVAFLRLFQLEPAGSTTRMDALIERGMRQHLGEAKGRMKFEKLKASSTVLADGEIQKMLAGVGGTLEAPFGYSPKGFGSYSSPAVDTGYFDALYDAFTPVMLQRKIGELQAHPNRKLLLPENFAEHCEVDPAAERRLIQVLFVYPFRGSVRHPDTIWVPLCDYIGQHYRKVMDLGPQGYGYSVWGER